eukprot:9227516-Lingulodinium_polyedra.AAC.1
MAPDGTEPMQREGSMEYGAEELAALRECIELGSIAYAEAHALLERSAEEITLLGRQETVEALAPST